MARSYFDLKQLLNRKALKRLRNEFCIIVTFREAKKCTFFELFIHRRAASACARTGPAAKRRRRRRRRRGRREIRSRRSGAISS
jgi:hypothetical protein